MEDNTEIIKRAALNTMIESGVKYLSQLEETKKMEQEEKIVEQKMMVDTIIEDAIDPEDNDTNNSNTSDKVDIVTNDIELDEMDEFLNSLSEMPFIEMVSMQRKVDNNILYLEEYSKVVETFKNLDIQDPLNTHIMKNNYLESKGIDHDIDEFEKLYSENIEKLKRAKEKLTEAIAAYGDDTEKTSFLTEQMRYSIQKKIESLNPEGLNYSYNLKRLEIVDNAFGDRTNLDYLIRKAKTFVSNKATIKAFRKFSKNESNRKKYYKELQKVFSDSLIDKVKNKIIEMTDESVYNLFIMFLSRICETEKRSANDVWVKILMLNIGDILSDQFDIGDSEEYMNKIKSELLEIFKLNL